MWAPRRYTRCWTWTSTPRPPAEVPRGGRAVDVGCGPLGIVPLLAERVGPEGEVVALDRQWEMLAHVADWAEAEGRCKQLILTCGGARVSNELAKELGYDAGFSKGTYPNHVASFIVRELAARMAASRDGAAAAA